MKSTIVIVIGLAIAGVIIYGIYLYNKPHADIGSKQPEFVSTAQMIYREFETNLNAAQKKYKEKVVKVSGAVAAVRKNQEGAYSILLNGEGGIINCEFTDKAPDLEKQIAVDDEISVKGLMVGYNDLLSEVQLKKCMIVE